MNKDTRNRIIPPKKGKQYYAVRIVEDRYCYRLRIYVKCDRHREKIMKSTCNNILTFECHSMDECIEKACRIIRNKTAYRTKTPIRRILVGDNNAVHQNSQKA